MAKKELPIVNIACKNTASVAPNKEAQSSADRIDQHCGSMRAYQMPPRANGVVTYKCVKCKHVWSVSIGGSFHGI